MLVETAKSSDIENLACPLCGGARFRTLATPEHWIGTEVFGPLEGRLGLVRCRGCDLVFVNPRPSGQRLAAFYSGNTYSCHEASGSGAEAAKADFLLLKRIEPCLSPDAPRTLLDYGAGGGQFLRHARMRGWTVRGFEPGRRGREACLAAGLDVVSALSALPAGAFNVVTLNHVFEHLTDPIGTLNSIRRLLARDGKLFIEVPNAGSLRAVLARPAFSRRGAIDERYRAFPIHLIYYTKRTLRRMLDRAGWHVDRMYTVGLGVDELFVREDRPSAQRAQPESGTDIDRTPRRWRHLLRDAILRMGWGENVAVLAHPIRRRSAKES